MFPLVNFTDWVLMKGEKSILVTEGGCWLFCSVVVGRVRKSRRDLMQAAVRQLSLRGTGCTVLGVRAKLLTTDHRQVSLSATRAFPTQYHFFCFASKDTANLLLYPIFLGIFKICQSSLHPFFFFFSTCRFLLTFCSLLQVLFRHTKPFIMF